MASFPRPADLLPHAAPMVLIDSVRAWDADSISCSASSHRADDNPLRINGHLSVYCGIEYAAQAMAAHASLSAPSGEAPRSGFVATASKVSAHAQALDAVSAELDIRANRIADNGDSSLYEFTITAEGQPLLDGQLMVVTQP